jgi:hypothetical protein
MKLFIALFFGLTLFGRETFGQSSCNDFHFGFCDISLGGVIDSFQLPASESAIAICQKACQVGSNT